MLSRINIITQQLQLKNIGILGFLKSLKMGEKASLTELKFNDFEL